MPFEPVHELFRRCSGMIPEALAIDRPDGGLTYARVAALADRVASFLARGGAGKGELVAILAERPEETVPAILGTLQAGGAFVPLDPRLPVARLAAMVQTVSPGWFLIAEEQLPRLRELALQCPVRARVACLDREIEAADLPEGWAWLPGLTSCPSEPVQASWGPDDLCYVFFTSGSTGTPKGIAGRIKGIDHFVRWEIETFGLGQGTRVSQLTVPSFDAFLRDIFVPLASGGTICPPADGTVRQDRERLRDWLEERRIHLLHCAPSVFRLLLSAPLETVQFSDLKYILMAGERLLSADVRRWQERFGDRVTLVNLYGPSETTMVKFFHVVRPEDLERPVIPIGRPMPGAGAILVDPNDRPCPPGAVGEILLRTPFRSLGYFNAPEETARAFVSNPFRKDPTDVVYRTGDLGRVLPDGNFEFLGRKDQQVKIHGVRVELGEIENHLRAHPAVNDVTVVDRQDREETFLCAYVVLGGAAHPRELRAHLAERLPEVMLPAAFVVLPALPRTNTGKIDRNALPPPVRGARAAQDMCSTEPGTPIEQALAEIFSELLGVSDVATEDGFFELGGNSFLTVRFLARVRTLFSVELAVDVLFTDSTLGALARRLEQSLQNGRERRTPPLAKRTTTGVAPLSFAQEPVWRWGRLRPEVPFFNLPAAFHLTGPLERERLRAAFVKLIERHESLRTLFVGDGDRVVQRSAPPAIDLALTDLRSLSAGERAREAERITSSEASRPLDLAGPMLRARLLVLSDDEHVLFFTLHHIAADGSSLRILVRDLAMLYQDPASEVEDDRLDYADFATWQRLWLSGEEWTAELAFWRQRLAGCAVRPDLPFARPRPLLESYRAESESIALPGASLRTLQAFARREGATLFMACLAVFKALLHLRSGAEDLLVVSPVSIRNRPELGDLVGLLVNPVPFRTWVESNLTFGELLRRVRATALEAYAHSDLPFGTLVEELGLGEANEAGAIAFDVQGSQIRPFELSDLRIAPLEVRRGAARADLALTLFTSGEYPIARLTYKTELFAPAEAAELLKDYAAMLEWLARHPEQCLSEIAVPCLGRAVPALLAPESPQLSGGSTHP
ncbi:MAG TPA: amino acid adenylation domain-containing protein [Thermoanaerobaculia bacterium]|nr:amino acid adenylation domain-containing protein [Thermoanaerobaculia bacterium]